MARKRNRHIQCPLSRSEEVPEGMWRLAQRRTAHLEAFTFSTPADHLLASAYLQGVNDALDVQDQTAK